MVSSSFWRYQPVDSGFVTETVLPYTDAQVGAGNVVESHEDTNQPGDYARYPQVVTDQPEYRRSWRPGAGSNRIDYHAFTARDPSVGAPAGDYRFASATGVTTGVTIDPLNVDEHGPVSPADIRTLAAQPQNRKTLVGWLRDCLHVKDATGTVRETVVPALGTDDPVTREREVSDAAISSLNAFQLIDVRRTWDTPVLPGMIPDRDGKYHVGKAGYPLTEDLYTPETYTVANTRDHVPNNAAPMLSDRVRAGAANPADPSQTRPAEYPHWTSDRLFDQGIAQRLTGQKGVTAGKLSARPTQTTMEDVQDMAQAGGKGGNQRRSAAPGMSPAGPQPSTVRNIPEPWDAALYVDASGGSAAARRAGWRL